MRILSSKKTHITKKVIIPLVFFLGIFCTSGMLHEKLNDSPNQLVLPLLLIVVWVILGFKVYNDFYRKFADEVYDCGDFLRIRLGKKEALLPLEDIINVNFSRDKSNNMSVVIYSSSALFSGLSTKKVSFMPNKDTMLPDVQSYIDSFIERIDDARTKKFKGAI